jgi:hypothetical protein
LKLILTDVDETVLKYADPFQDWCEMKGYSMNGRLRDMHDICALLDVDAKTADEIIREFSESGALDTQPPEDCALEVLPQLYQKGFRFVAITACGNDPIFRLKRRRCLENTFGFAWEDVHTIGLGDSKGPLLSMYPPSVWVEDHFIHSVRGAEIGHKTFLLTREYNQGRKHPKVNRVVSWFDIYDSLVGDD